MSVEAARSDARTDLGDDDPVCHCYPESGLVAFCGKRRAPDSELTKYPTKPICRACASMMRLYPSGRSN